MRTYLIRLTSATAGAVLSSVTMAGVALSNEEPQPFVEPCDGVAPADEVLPPADDGPAIPQKPLELVPCYQIPTYPDDEDEGGDDGDDDGDDEGEDGDNNGNGHNGEGGHKPGANGGQDGGPQGGQGAATGGAGTDAAPEEDAANPDGATEPTAEAEPTPPVTTDHASPASRDAGGPNAVLALFAGALGAAGLGIFGYALRKRSAAR